MRRISHRFKGGPLSAPDADALNQAIEALNRLAGGFSAAPPLFLQEDSGGVRIGMGPQASATTFTGCKRVLNADFTWGPIPNGVHAIAFQTTTYDTGSFTNSLDFTQFLGSNGSYYAMGATVNMEITAGTVTAGDLLELEINDFNGSFHASASFDLTNMPVNAGKIFGVGISTQFKLVNSPLTIELVNRSSTITQYKIHQINFAPTCGWIEKRG